MKLENVFNLIKAERARQDAMYGPQGDRTLIEWHAILAEEMGEVSKEVNEIYFNNKDMDDLFKELIQTCAVAMHMLESLEE